ncbi:MAG: hypothetical protein U1F98_05230 [Verrucomicrobiota bacterium]
MNLPAQRLRFLSRAALAVCLAGCWAAFSAFAQPAPRGPVPARSVSGQFIVFPSKPAARSRERDLLEHNTNYIQLDPNLLAISCERIRQKLCDQLGASTAWKGKIFLNLRPASGPGDNITVLARHDIRGWTYRLDVPDILLRGRFVCGIVEVVLLEMANRSAGEHSAEIPVWMAEGFARELAVSGDISLLLSRPSQNVNGLTLNTESVVSRWSDPLEKARETLNGQPPLSFEELSWPFDDGLAPAAAERFGASAQLFVMNLLQFQDGGACFRRMLDALPGCYNWQLAFFKGFQPHFQSALDVEKWWALQGVQLETHSVSARWTPEQSWRKLTQLVHPAAAVRTSETELPTYTEVTLQTIVQQWDRNRQSDALRQKLGQLQMMQLRIAPQFVDVLNGYRDVIQWFLKKRSDTGLLSLLRRAPAMTPAGLASETIRKLDDLDARLAALRPVEKPSVSAALDQGTVQ